MVPRELLVSNQSNIMYSVELWGLINDHSLRLPLFDIKSVSVVMLIADFHDSCVLSYDGPVQPNIMR